MMIDKRLVGFVPESKKYIAANVALQWISMISNVCIMGCVASVIGKLYGMGAEGASTVDVVQSIDGTSGVQGMQGMYGLLIAIIVCIIIRFVCTKCSARMSYMSSRAVKKTLREKIYLKLLTLGRSYKEMVKTSEVVQVAVEGVDQLETYFGAYLPQFFYAMLAPLTLFVILAFVSVPSAIVLLVCVPLIPVAIAVVQTWAKKLLSKYWDQYTALGDSFLENLQGLTTLKIYQSDKYKHEQMNVEAEHFRRITMKVLTMQLNSITIMDIVAYGGMALGAVMAVTQFAAGKTSMAGCLFTILVAADFFIPMRQLGSFFHIAMNGMAASEKIFRLLDIEAQEDISVGSDTASTDSDSITGKDAGKAAVKNAGISIKNLSYTYKDGEGRRVLDDVNIEAGPGGLTALVGESGCGKSTIAGILTGSNRGYEGSISCGEVTYLSHNSYIFKGTVRDNLRMAAPDATEQELWDVLERAELKEYLLSENGLDTYITERGSNLSGGQRQRLAYARAILKNTDIYIFDEATSNVDVVSEDIMMREIYRLAEDKTVLLISHRLANVEKAAHIYVLKDGTIAEEGTHESLMAAGGVYYDMVKVQSELENYMKSSDDEATKGGAHDE